MGKASKLAKSKNVSKQLKEPVQKASHKIRTKLRFYRPKTQKTKSAPKMIRSLQSEIKRKTPQKLDATNVLIQPVSSDKNIQKMENQNTLTFLVHPEAKKPQIKEAVGKLYSVKVRKINTLNTSKGKKKAFIRLMNDNDALNIASKIGLL